MVSVLGVSVKLNVALRQPAGYIFGFGFLTLRLFCSNHKGEFLLWMI